MGRSRLGPEENEDNKKENKFDVVGAGLTTRRGGLSKKKTKVIRREVDERRRQGQDASTKTALSVTLP